MKYLLLGFCIILLILFVFRRFGEKAFTVYARNIPEQKKYKNTSLYIASEKVLSSDSQDDNNYLIPLGNPQAAFLSRIALIDAAERTLDLQYYLFHGDDAGDALLAAIIKAVKRGVIVRLLLDDMDILGREKNFILLSKRYKNLSIYIFNPFYIRKLRAIDFISRFPRSSRRMHNKSLTADRIVSIVGGRNIGNEYFHINTEFGFIDYDAMVTGKIGQDISNEFDHYWYSGIAFDISTLGGPNKDDEFKNWHTSLFSSLTQYSHILQKEDNAVKKLIQNNITGYFGKTNVIYDPANKVISGVFHDKKWMSTEIIELMQTSEKSLDIISPYFIPGITGLKVLSDLVEKGVKVSIITNSFAANDVLAVHAGYSRYRKKLLKAGIKLYELKPTSDDNNKLSFFGSKRVSLHAKIFVIDETISFVGSYNLDPRSALHNTEMGLVFTNKIYAKNTVNYVKKHLEEKTYSVTLNDNNLQWKDEVADTAIIHTKEPNTDVLGRILIVIVQILPVEWLL